MEQIRDKKILLIHHGTGVGGGLIALLSLLQDLKKSNEVTVFTIFPSIANSYIENIGVKVITPKMIFYKKNYNLLIESEADYVSVFNIIMKLKAFINFILNKNHFVKKEFLNLINDFDTVYLNSTFISDFAKFFKKEKKTVYIHVREPLKTNTFFSKVIRNNIKKYCDKIICITKDNCERINLHDKSFIQYDKVFRRGEMTSKINFSFNDQFSYFTYVGGEMRIKGFEQFVNCLGKLEDNIRIFYLGGQLNYSPSHTLLKKIVRNIFFPYYRKNLKLREKLLASRHIINVGLTDDVFFYLENSKALISPFSKPHASLPILEAFSVNKPVIVSNVAGMDEFVINNFNGFIFNNLDSSDLASKINKFAKLDKTVLERLSKNVNESYKMIYDN